MFYETVIYSEWTSNAQIYKDLFEYLGIKNKMK